MIQGEHSAILLTCIKLPFSIKTYVLSICKWPLIVYQKTNFAISTLIFVRIKICNGKHEALYSFLKKQPNFSRLILVRSVFTQFALKNQSSYIRVITDNHLLVEGKLLTYFYTTLALHLYVILAVYP